ncbi:hypothetical protein TNCV_514971 [Trichonephila clavipes]|nr:hypothetical protein TNCV_514971 [Trichonephila clavipes]
MATGSYMTPIYSRSQSEVQGDLHIVTELGVALLVGREAWQMKAGTNGKKSDGLGFGDLQLKGYYWMKELLF